MTHHDVDVAILGAGTAGMRAARAARAHADRVLLIQDGPYGTVCAREGCMPSKLLIAAAHAAHAAGEAKVIDQRVMKNSETGGWRAFFKLDVPESTKLLELTCELKDGAKVVSERWMYQWRR